MKMDNKKKIKKTVSDTVCRVHKFGGYAVLSNCFVRSTNLGCPAIGLLGRVLDLPPEWNFTKAGLIAVCPDGETAVESALADLEEWGYLQKIVQMPSLVCAPVRIGQYGKGGQGQRIYSVRGKSVTLSANGGGQGAKTGLYKIDLPDGDYIIRKLTPVEAERLQTLPDNYTADISNTQRYKCIGNGWTVDVIAHILGGLNCE